MEVRAAKDRLEKPGEIDLDSEENFRDPKGDARGRANGMVGRQESSGLRLPGRSRAILRRSGRSR